MTFAIDAPTTIEQPLYEERLEIAESAVQLRSSAVRQQLLDMAPAVTLGQPQCWNLATMAQEKGELLAAEMSLMLREADFYLLQLASSFHPQRQARVMWARVDVYLQSTAGENPPLAFDLYPRELYEKPNDDLKVTIDPSLSFGAFGAKVEGKLGQILTTIRFRELEPVVVAYGLLQPNCGWDYQRSHQTPLAGIQVSYLIVKKPHGADAVRVTIDVKAEVSTPSGLFGMRVTEQDKAQRTVVVCSK